MKFLILVLVCLLSLSLVQVQAQTQSQSEQMQVPSPKLAKKLSRPLTSAKSGLSLSAEKVQAKSPGSSDDLPLIPLRADAARSCWAQRMLQPADVPGHHYQLNNFSITWADRNADLIISYMILEIRHPWLGNGLHRATLFGRELENLDGRGVWNAWLPHATPQGPSIFRAACGPLVGNIIVTNHEEDFEAKGQLTLVGVRRDFRGFERAVQFSTPLRIIHHASE